MSTTTILDKILRKLKKFRESISQLFYYSSRKRNRFALAGKGCRTWRSSNANPTCNGKQLISAQRLQYESLVPKELWFLSVGVYQYLSRCVLWGAHSLTGICLLLSPARPAPDVAHFHLGQNPKAHRRESHFPGQTELPELGPGALRGGADEVMWGTMDLGHTHRGPFCRELMTRELVVTTEKWLLIRPYL